MNKKCVAIAFAALVAASAFAQAQSTAEETNPYAEVMTAYTDSLNQVLNKYAQTTTGYVTPNPCYYRLFCPVTVYNSVVSDAMAMDDDDAATTTTQSVVAYSANGLLESDEAINEHIDNTLMDLYLNNPTAVTYTQSDVMSTESFKAETTRNMARAERMADRAAIVAAGAMTHQDEVVIKKPNFWTKSGDGYLQITQSYISDNWYNGGESNNTLLAGVTLEANYNDQQKLQWDNKLEWKLGVYSANSDTYHKYRTNADLFRLTSKLGIQATKHWYYTIQALFYTQFFENYSSNSASLNSNFLSPGYLQVDLGMDYKRSWKKVELTAVIAPLSYKLTYVDDGKVRENKWSSYDLKDVNHFAQNDFGSNIQINATTKFTSNISWVTRLYYFTTYSKVQSEWENTFNFSVNKYLTTKLFVHARFDDSADPFDSKNQWYKYFQLSELFSFGLSYTW